MYSKAVVPVASRCDGNNYKDIKAAAILTYVNCSAEKEIITNVRYCSWKHLQILSAELQQ